MPNVIIDFLEGRTVEQKREMAKRVTAAIAETLDCPPEVIQIIMHEISKDQVAYAGVLLSDKDLS
ncbi:4-oxalocrotonate tautomerase [Gilliamella apicola]|jgi:4-oxalocrotonate tautomerase family enzyme|uniref:Tautomerase n=1 Tax=Gilliamella apicola TaxID=1196095 RepID=A0A556SAL7_9GAMM|nr:MULTISPECIES: 2-hydroxymuconate tautomerase [Gilliamella]MBI0095609.1 2-hydroxymuconate tautomerase family protein [Gilliamella sp. W8136]OTP97575.1 4-oxalocrotonate tautomerase [Gilliamella apicola]OTQ25144.1 4-oxalocrotonate tautomerase [Gilliamella apicola]TSJ98158.1 4-oxalocrotonate tautomerase [Gilliamella apicola]